MYAGHVREINATGESGVQLRVTICRMIYLLEMELRGV